MRWAIILELFFAFILVFMLVRVSTPSELDDLSPEIPCDNSLIQKSDVLWVIPLYNKTSISDAPQWCEKILKLNKTLGLHGVYHTYQEFESPKNAEYLQSGISAFKNCFNQTPAIFKSPHLAILPENKKLVESNGLIVYNKLNQVTHKVYHCSDTGVFPNWFINFF